MARSVVEVVKVIAPIALDALAQAATALLADEKLLAAQGYMSAGNSAEEDANIIDKDTTTYVNSAFGNNFRYFFKGLGSSPPHAQYPLLGATEDIMVWNPALNETTDIQNYIQQVLQDTLSDSDALEVAQNLSALFQARFADIELSWTPFMKRYNLSSGVTIDLQMVTAAGYDSAKNPMGLATYCFVAYKTTNTFNKKEMYRAALAKQRLYATQRQAVKAAAQEEPVCQ